MSKPPIADKGTICPLHKQDVSKVCHKCPWYILVRGKHPQSEEHIDQWGCAVQFLPMLLIEGAQQSRQTGAAVESFRNVFAEAGNNMLSLMHGGGSSGGGGVPLPRQIK
jgi:hypothetical protein